MFKRVLLVLVALLTVSVVSVSTVGAQEDQSDVVCMYSFIDEEGTVEVSWSKVRDSKDGFVQVWVGKVQKSGSKGILTTIPNDMYIGKTKGTSLKFKESKFSDVRISYSNKLGARRRVIPCEFVDDVPEDSKPIPTKPTDVVKTVPSRPATDAKPDSVVAWPATGEKSAKAVNGSPKYTG